MRKFQNNQLEVSAFPLGCFMQKIDLKRTTIEKYSSISTKLIVNEKVFLYHDFSAKYASYPLNKSVHSQSSPVVDPKTSKLWGANPTGGAPIN